MIVIVIVIVFVPSRGYDHGVDILVLYARTGCLVDMVTGEYHMRDGKSTYMVTGEYHMRGFQICSVYVYMVMGEYHLYGGLGVTIGPVGFHHGLTT